MKIQKGSTMVMKGIKRGNLYIVQGITCIENGLVAIASKSNKSIPNLTQLWHMRLGHMSEKGMMILQKQQLLGNQKLDELKFCEHCVFGKQHKIKFQPNTNPGEAKHQASKATSQADPNNGQNGQPSIPKRRQRVTVEILIP